MTEVDALVAARLKAMREAIGADRQELEKQLLLGDGWLEYIESGLLPLQVGLVAAIAHALGSSLSDVLDGVDTAATGAGITRRLSIAAVEAGLELHFPYGDHDAQYLLADATTAEVERFFDGFRNALPAGKSDAIAEAFLLAVRLWPGVNPADLWQFLVHNAYCDPLNHPPSEARRDFEQSWKRSAGWALERVLVTFYEPFLAANGVHLEIPKGARKKELARQIRVSGRVEIDKIDVFLTGDAPDGPRCFGAVHVKASFAERRTDDVPLSQALIGSGYCSPLWTLDTKATPSASPVNKGELGDLLGEGEDTRSAKRKDIEEDGFFSACFSYNQNTKPTPADQHVAARVYACALETPDDEFAMWLLAEWDRFKTVGRRNARRRGGR